MIDIDKLLEREHDRDSGSDFILDTGAKVIKEFVDVDIFRKIMPILSKGDITIDEDFLKINKISPNRNKNFSSEELKTISYLAPFWKEKIQYNVNDINRYLWFLGYDFDNNPVDLVALNKYDIKSNSISYTEYLKLNSVPIYLSTHSITHGVAGNNVSHYLTTIEDDRYLDGFDILNDFVGVK